MRGIWSTDRIIFQYNPLILASTGLFLLMLGGFIVRLKIKDSFTQSFPAFSFAILNLFIAVRTLLTYF